MGIPRAVDSDTRSLAISLAVAGVLFVGDLFIPNGMAYGVSYTIVILLTLSSPKRRVTFAATAVATVLTILGAFLASQISPQAPLPEVVVNRLFAIAAIWAIAFIIVRHKTTAKALQLNQQHKAAIVDSVQAAFVEMNDSGRITGWNPHAEVVFGWNRDEAIGRPLAETIIPAGARSAHNRGLRRFLATGQGAILNRWIELQGQRRDGAVFPVELLLGVRQMESGDHGFFAFIQDVSERKLAEGQLRANHSLMAALAGRLISSHEDERRRLARHIHDDFSQRLAIWTITLAGAEQDSPQEVRHVMQDLREQAEQLASDLHEMSHRLHPAILQQLGLVASLRSECDRFQELERINCSFSSDVEAEVPDAIALTAYRVVQEGLRNVAKHAHAQHVEVRLASANGRIQASIADDGIGFTVGESDEKSHLGLLSMHERARSVQGRVTITSQPGQGARVELDMPLTAAAFRHDAAAKDQPALGEHVG